MGIKALKKLLADNAAGSIKESTITAYFGRKIAIDASMFLYSFLVAIRRDDFNVLTDASGETTSHLQGIFNRTVRLLECGIKPVYVFDGKPPTMKGGELARRKDRKKAAEEELATATEQGDQEAVAKLVKQTVRVTRQHNEESQKLLRLMGVPVVLAPCEAEAQCAELTRAKKVWATATEDMDALTLGSPLLLRHLTMSEARKLPILEIRLEDVLQELSFSREQFVDLCILLGCDYVGTIRGVGPKTALNLMKTHGSLEEVVANLDEKYTLPENFDFVAARDLFLNSEVTPAEEVELNWGEPDEEGLIQFLVHDKQFSEKRVRSALNRIKAGTTKRSQGRLDSFFGAPKKRPRDEPEDTKLKSKKRKVAPKKTAVKKEKKR
eukprot:TRINITY_DN12005_c0_g1_i1.p1 TRINITY_DN12005_c0_g1~~TRINITY_DN12005_c0_g1_i1.p1  ORF type:complete len:381 (-),score=126.73 TRINITY_DN12005_c0_g1_i1:350-1492(-)